ncbi:MAG: ATPase [Bacteroidetes bacterium]|nr:MAG: ATPase [Bacteroidota bacterium]
MNTTNYPKFVELYDTYRNSEEYANRLKQFAIAAINKEIIQETLKNEPLLNEHLTGLIQMFKYGCTDDTFDRYLVQNIKDPIRRQEISKNAYYVNQWGYTGAGLNAVTSLTPAQLKIIKKFLQDAFAINTIDDAVILCSDYDDHNIPYIKSGIYSPWLYYINPQLFPILNNTHSEFRQWIDMPADYPSCIKDFNELRTLVNENELGVIDYFAYNFEQFQNLKSHIKVLNLNGKAFYKVSHGIFKKGSAYKNTGIAQILEKNSWACIHSGTGKNQGYEFEHNAAIGDYVYICYGGDDLLLIGKIISEAKKLDKTLNDLFGGDGKWIYRQIEPLYHPKSTSVRELKSDTRFFMPSGNSTFYKVSSQHLDYLNQNIFIPKVDLKIIDSDFRKEEPINNPTNQSENNISMNSILYGPPGTGKTFHSINHAVAIVEHKSIASVMAEDRAIVKNRYDQYVSDGQIIFCTFHQSLSYEDFIEGIKPIEPMNDDAELTYAVEDGIFKRLCTEAAFSFAQKNTSYITEKVFDFSAAYDRFVDMVNENFSKGVTTELDTRSGGKVLIDSISQNNNIWIQHNKENRKYTVSKKRLSKISQAFPDLTEVTNIHLQFRAVIGGSNSSAYWAVLNAIRKQDGAGEPVETRKVSEIEYAYDDKKEIIASLKNDDYKNENPKKFVLIIDEINRGNVSQIFGELITLIEADKRLGKNESLKAILPYSKECFGVPCNIYMIGTMNTADRSVEALDAALRRRFSFTPMNPQPELLVATADGINLPEILRILNTRLSILKDNDHTIGHAWLWDVSNVDELKIVYSDKILPLLQEYFYNDYEKLGLVLGDAFFKPHIQINSDIFASFSGGDGLAGQYDQSWQYVLKSADELTIDDFKSLLQQNNQIAFDEE